MIFFQQCKKIVTPNHNLKLTKSAGQKGSEPSAFTKFQRTMSHCYSYRKEENTDMF